jgi:hypothetical protein
MKTKLTNLLDRDDVIGLLRSEVAKAGSQSKWAKERESLRYRIALDIT